VRQQTNSTLVGLAKCLCQPPLTVNPHRPVCLSIGHRVGWQQPWWSGMHCILSWLHGRGRYCVSHSPFEHKRPL